MAEAVQVDEVGGLEEFGPALPVGTVVGRYRLCEPIGYGAQGRVYRAVNDIDRRFAIKMARRGEEKILRERFQQEARMGAMVYHRNVVGVIDYGLYEGAPYLVMDLAEGPTLADILDNEILSPDAVVDLGLQMLAAIHALDACGIVHRDVKPENLVVHREVDGDVVVKLIDFGISTASHRRHHRIVTGDGLFIGTPTYMSPERFHGVEADVRSDIFSVAAVLYESLCGHSPHPGESVVDIIDATLSGSLVPLCLRAPDCPETLAMTIHRGLSHNPQERPSHPEIMSQELREVGATLGLRRGGDAWAAVFQEIAREPSGLIPLRMDTADTVRDLPATRRLGFKAAAGVLGAALLAGVISCLALLVLFGAGCNNDVGGSGMTTPDGDASVASRDAAPAVGSSAEDTGPATGDLLWLTLEDATSITDPILGNGAGAGFMTDPADDFEEGQMGNGLRIDGDGEFLEVPQEGNVDWTHGTLDFWYLPDNSQNDGVEHVLFAAADATVRGGFIGRKAPRDESNAFIVTFYDASAATVAETQIDAATFTFTPGTWIEIRVTWDFEVPEGEQAVHVYFDGTEASYMTTMTMTPASMPDATSGALLRFGVSPSEDTSPAGGVLDEIHLAATVMAP